MKKILLITSLLLLLTGCKTTNTINSDLETTKNSNTSESQQDSTQNPGTNKNQEKPKVNTNSPSTTPSEIGYIDYTPDNLKSALSSNKKVILYFAASWCPTCRALDKELEEKASEVPNDALIIRLDYDKEQELKEKYKINYQHTLVWIDSDMNEIKKWQGGGIALIRQEIASR